MSMPFLIFTCDRCGIERCSTVAWGRFSYEAPTGRIDLVTTLGWCNSCNDLVPIEVLPTAESVRTVKVEIADKSMQLRKIAADLLGRRSWIQRLFKIAPTLTPEAKELEWDLRCIEEHLEQLIQRVAVLQHRVSDGRCLHCGQTDWHQLAFQKNPWSSDGPTTTSTVHPACGGRFSVRRSELSLSMRLTHRLYDVHGRFLREEAQR
jgi:hypothetical protein